MTNREYMIEQLSDPNCFDDGGASYEAMIYYNINCPYSVNDKRGHCYGSTSKDMGINRTNCFECKEEWLDQEVDE